MAGHVSATEAICDFIVNARFDDFPSQVVDKAKEGITDFVGVALAGTGEAITLILNDYAMFFGGKPQATIIGSGEKTSLINAAMVNGALGHVLDYDDWSMIIWGHPSVFLVPNVFALGEYLGASGKDVITAYLVGFEVEALIPWHAKKEHYDMGWHITGTLGSIGAAASAAWLMKLDRQQTQMAMGIAGSLAAGIRANNGTMTKALHAGNAAANGIRAAHLARSGFTAITNMFEVERGLVNAFGFQKELNWPELLDKLGVDYAITSNEGLIIKPYPSCGGTAFSIDAVKHLRKKHTFTLEDIADIELWVNPLAGLPLIYHNPATGLEGKFSGEYTLARALVSGDVGLRDFTDDAVNEPAIKALMAKIKWLVKYPMPGTGASDEFDPKGVLIRFNDGRQLFEEVFYHTGMPQNPMPKDQFESKFRECAGLCLESRKVENALSQLNKLEKLNNISELIDILF